MLDLDDTQPTDEILEALLIKTVQGHPSPASCLVVAGKLVQSDQPIPKCAKPNLTLLALYLRTAAAVSDTSRDWIVTLFRATRPDTRSPYLRPWEENSKDRGDASKNSESEEAARLRGQQYNCRDISTACRVKAIERRKRGNPKNARYTHWTESLPVKTRMRMQVIKLNLTDTPPVNDFTLLYLTLKDRSLSAHDRVWLADIFDPASSFDFQVKEILRRQPGREPANETLSPQMRKAAEEIERRCVEDKRKPPSERTGLKKIVYEVATLYGKQPAWAASALSFARVLESLQKK